MTSATQPASTPAPGDDWNSYWGDCGDVARNNPVNQYRRELIKGLLDLPADGSRARILDIGSGQGELALHLDRFYPRAVVRGIEYSEEGVRRSRQRSAEEDSGASFSQRDLLTATELDAGEREWATHAVCSEVLEHVDSPEVLLRHAREYLAPGCRLAVTVPSGPISDFDRHIGHRKHFKPEELARLLVNCGFSVHRVARAGFPFYNLYRVAVVTRGAKAIDDASRPVAVQSRANRLAFASFRLLLRADIRSSPWGWQLTAVAERPGK